MSVIVARAAYGLLLGSDAASWLSARIVALFPTLSNNLGRPLEPLLRSYDPSQARERREGASPSFEFKCDKTGFAGSRGPRTLFDAAAAYMHPDLAVPLFVVSITAAVALLAYFRVPLGGCGASSALDDFAPKRTPKRTPKRKKHADD